MERKIWAGAGKLSDVIQLFIFPWSTSLGAGPCIWSSIYHGQCMIQCIWFMIFNECLSASSALHFCDETMLSLVCCARRKFRPCGFHGWWMRWQCCGKPSKKTAHELIPILALHVHHGHLKTFIFQVQKKSRFYLTCFLLARPCWCWNLYSYGRCGQRITQPGQFIYLSDRHH